VGAGFSPRVRPEGRTHMKTWQKWGLLSTALFLTLSVILETTGRWWYQQTIWFSILMTVNYPATKVQRVFLNLIGVPRLYDVSLSLNEKAIMYLSGIVLGSFWWFVIGAVGSTILKAMAKRLKSGKR
jgi:hypothetical protein